MRRAVVKWVAFCAAMILLASAVFAAEITVVGWNVESGGANMGVLAKQIQDLKGIDIWGFCEVLDESWAKIFRQSANKSSESRRGKFRESGIPLILMGDWCGELSIADTNARNPGKGEAEASVGAVLE